PAQLKSARRFVAEAIFSSRPVQRTRVVISAPLRPTTNWLPITGRRFIGVTRHCLKKDYAWRKKAIERPRLRPFIKFWKTSRPPASDASCSGTTKPGLMLRDYWRKIQNGNPLSRSMTNSSRPEAIEATKQKRV